MVKQIKLESYKGIKSLELKNLEHVNIICGKNSSGKSSILEAINNPKNRDLGLKQASFFKRDLKLIGSHVKSLFSLYSSI
ncbi:MAG: AAA family ATPase [bacterium]